MEVIPTQQSLFDYNSLDTDTREFVQEKAQSIHTRLKRTVEDIIAIGQDLREVKEMPGMDMKFSAWLRAEFEMTRQTAYRFMGVAKKFEGCNIMLQLSPTALYSLLDMPDAVIEMVETGEISPTLPDIREAKRYYTEAEVQVDSPVLPGPVYGSTHTLGPNMPREVTMGEKAYPPLPSSTKEESASPFEIPYEEVDEEDESVPTVVKSVNRDGVPVSVPHIISKNNEWYTPARYVEAARELMGSIDVDPASCGEANETVRATVYYDISTNGLEEKDWTGHVWLNPPYGRDEGGSNQDTWSRRLIKQYEAGITREAVLLVNAAVDTKWFQRLFKYPVCLTLGRINFSTPEPIANGSTHGSAFVYLGSQRERFIEIFSQFGVVVERVGCDGERLS